MRRTNRVLAGAILTDPHYIAVVATKSAQNIDAQERAPSLHNRTLTRAILKSRNLEIWRHLADAHRRPKWLSGETDFGKMAFTNSMKARGIKKRRNYYFALII